jgi:hypothetical protein
MVAWRAKPSRSWPVELDSDAVVDFEDVKSREIERLSSTWCRS